MFYSQTRQELLQADLGSLWLWCDWARAEEKATITWMQREKDAGEHIFSP